MDLLFRGVLIGRVLGSWVMRWSVKGQTQSDLHPSGSTWPGVYGTQVGRNRPEQLPHPRLTRTTSPLCHSVYQLLHGCCASELHHVGGGTVLWWTRNGMAPRESSPSMLGGCHPPSVGGHVPAMGVRSPCVGSPFLFLLFFLPIFFSHSPPLRLTEWHPRGQPPPPTHTCLCPPPSLMDAIFMNPRRMLVTSASRAVCIICRL